MSLASMPRFLHLYIACSFLLLHLFSFLVLIFEHSPRLIFSVLLHLLGHISLLCLRALNVLLRSLSLDTLNPSVVFLQPLEVLEVLLVYHFRKICPFVEVM